MRKSKKGWPEPKYNPGPAKHLHAVGVIATRFNALERAMFFLFCVPLDRNKFPRALYETYYFTLDERKRLAALTHVFHEFEPDHEVKSRVDNMSSYFSWCSKARNEIVHGEHYPTLFADQENILHLIKPLSKRTTTSGYLSLNLKEIRRIADLIQAGVEPCANIQIFLRYRDTPPLNYRFRFARWQGLSRTHCPKNSRYQNLWNYRDILIMFQHRRVGGNRRAADRTPSAEIAAVTQGSPLVRFAPRRLPVAVTCGGSTAIFAVMPTAAALRWRTNQSRSGSNLRSNAATSRSTRPGSISSRAPSRGLP